MINHDDIYNICIKYVKELLPLKQFDMNNFYSSMCHYSSCITNKKSYERLEFLGDTIFHMIISKYIYDRFPDEDVGLMTKIRISIEKGITMTNFCEILGLDKFVIKSNLIKINKHIKEDIFESFVAAFYLTFGLYHTNILIINILEEHWDFSENIQNNDNYKDILLRYYHYNSWNNPEYDTIYHEKKFTCMIQYNNEILGIGCSKIKKEAEQEAAHNALLKLNVIEDIKLKKKKIKDSKSIIHNKNNKLLTNNKLKEILFNYGILKNFTLSDKLLKESMTHKSYLVHKSHSVNKKGYISLQKKSNNRLQFLGSSVIHFILSKFLYNLYNYQEGLLTQIRSKLEDKKIFYELAKKSRIIDFVLISNNIETYYGRENINIISGAFEALFGVFLIEDKFIEAESFFIKLLSEININEIINKQTNYKDLILQHYNKYHLGQPKYVIIAENGPDHSKNFSVKIQGRTLIGNGNSIKKAEQDVSKKLYKEIYN